MFSAPFSNSVALNFKATELENGDLHSHTTYYVGPSHVFSNAMCASPSFSGTVSGHTRSVGDLSLITTFPGAATHFSTTSMSQRPLVLLLKPLVLALQLSLLSCPHMCSSKRITATSLAHSFFICVRVSLQLEYCALTQYRRYSRRGGSAISVYR